MWGAFHFREIIIRKYDLVQIFENLGIEGIELGHIVLNVSNYCFKKLFTEVF